MNEPDSFIALNFNLINILILIIKDLWIYKIIQILEYQHLIFIQQNCGWTGWWKEKGSTTSLITFLLASGLMKRWWNVILLVVSVLDYPIINSSSFQPSSSLLWKRQRNPCLYAAVPAGSHACTTDTEYHVRLAKKKGKNKPPIPPQAFGEQKAIAH